MVKQGILKLNSRLKIWQQEQPYKSRCYPVIVALYALCMFTSMLTSYCFFHFSLFSMHFTSAVCVFMIAICFLLSDICTESYDYKHSRWMNTVSLIIVGVILLLLQLTDFFSDGRGNVVESHYVTAYHVIFTGIFTHIWLSNAIAMLLGANLSAKILYRLRLKYHENHLFLRVLCSNFLGEIVFTSTVIFLVTFNKTTLGTTFSMIIISFMLKIVTTIASSFFIIPISKRAISLIDARKDLSCRLRY